MFLIGLSQVFATVLNHIQPAGKSLTILLKVAFEAPPFLTESRIAGSVIREKDENLWRGYKPPSDRSLRMFHTHENWYPRPGNAELVMGMGR